MKNKIIIALIFLSASFSSCSDWLDIKPLDSTIVEDFWKTSNDVESVVLSCYKELLSNSYIQHILLTELRSDNIMEGRSMSRDLQYILESGILDTNPYTVWEPFYTAINYCNTVLHYASLVTELDPDYTPGLLGAHRAEALTLRALSYFYLIRIYGDVPYITTPSIDNSTNFKIPQTSADEILDLLIQDLLVAEQNAVQVRGNKNQYNFGILNKGRVTKNTVRALLADIYLWKFQYEDCIGACNRILENFYTKEDLDRMDPNNLTGEEYVLEEGDGAGGSFYNIFYGKNSTESIFELQFDLTNTNTTIPYFYGEEQNVGVFSASELNAAEWELFTQSDLRGKDFFIDEKESSGYLRIFKYIGQYRREVTSGNGTYFFAGLSFQPNWIIYRIPDILLMKAEALVEFNSRREDLQKALDLVNVTYLRSNPTVSMPLAFEDYSTQELMRDLVLKERHRELLFEGKRWFDLLRLARKTGSTEAVVSLLTRKATNPEILANRLSSIEALYLPINREETQINRELKQNSYYEEILNKE